MSVTESSFEAVIEFGKLQGLYDRHQYLDAYSLTSGLWQDSTDIRQLSTEELILASRLAARLGGGRLSRWLLRKALKRDQFNPKVRYFARNIKSSKERLLNDLRAFNAQPDLGGSDPDLRAFWYASHGFAWATLRDFDRAHECFTQ